MHQYKNNTPNKIVYVEDGLKVASPGDTFKTSVILNIPGVIQVGVKKSSKKTVAKKEKKGEKSND
jgi:hypothetical protein|tara:strand:- start:56 stop:250 length:195 start_codon:yes stop_codon:yes gene_type:complete